MTMNKDYFVIVFEGHTMVYRGRTNDPKAYLQELLEEWGYDDIEAEDYFTEFRSKIAEVAYESDNNEEIYFFEL